MKNFDLAQKVIFRGELAFITNASIAQGKYYQVETLRTGKRFLVGYWELTALSKAKILQVDRLVLMTHLTPNKDVQRAGTWYRLKQLQVQLKEQKKYFNIFE